MAKVDSGAELGSVEEAKAEEAIQGRGAGSGATEYADQSQDVASTAVSAKAKAPARRRRIACAISVGGIDCLIVSRAEYEELRERAANGRMRGEARGTPRRRNWLPSELAPGEPPAVAGDVMSGDVGDQELARSAGEEAAAAPTAALRAEACGDPRTKTYGERHDVIKTIREARRQAGLSQHELARRLGRSQSMVSQAERGLARLGQRYVRTVLDACGIEATWNAAASRGDEEHDVTVIAGREEDLATGWSLEVAGLDPETFLTVRKGSPRDLELCEKLEWWRRRSDL